jgi:Uncharacterized protein conserved in bacteria (DUF2130)
LRAWPALAVALREQLIEVAFAHAAAEGKSEKMELLYHYLAGDQFRRRIEATVEAFTALRRGLDGERRAMERIWKEREKQIDRVLANTAGMYGEVRGILGASEPPVPALELDGSPDGSKMWRSSCLDRAYPRHVAGRGSRRIYCAVQGDHGYRLGGIRRRQSPTSDC